MFCIGCSVGCSASSTPNYHDITSESGERVNFVCVVPLYQKLTGVAIGPDGKGSTYSDDAYLMRPFRFEGGSDFSKHVMPNERFLIPIPPGFAFGSTWIPVRFLLLKRGFEPLLLRGHETHRSAPFSLKATTSSRLDELMGMLMDKQANRERLRDYFQLKSTIKSIQMDYTDSDRELLGSCLNDATNRVDERQ